AAATSAPSGRRWTVQGGAPPGSARGEGRGREGSNGPGRLTRRRGRGPRTPGQRRRENVGKGLRPAGAARNRPRPGVEGRPEPGGGGRTGAGARPSDASRVPPGDGV